MKNKLEDMTQEELWQLFPIFLVEHRHSAASQGIQRDKTHAKATRRRGQALEATVLKAAWEILNEVGYEQLTMAGVAKRAQATKPVLYRRWPDKASRHSAW